MNHTYQTFNQQNIKEKMTQLNIKTETVVIKNDDINIDSYLAMPTEEGVFPGVIVIQEIFGVNDHIRDITRRFAQQGYVAIAPAIYQRLAPGFETGYTAEAINIGRSYKNQTKENIKIGIKGGGLFFLQRRLNF